MALPGRRAAAASAPRARCSFDLIARDDELRRARRRNDDVGGSELVVDAIQTDRARAERAGELLGARGRAVGDDRDLGAARKQVAGRLLADLARTDEQDAAPSQVAEHLVGERSRRRGDRRRGLADRRLHSCPPASVERLAEEPAQHRPRCTRFERQPHLAEDLALARHERIEARSDTEEVQRRRLVLELVERVRERRLSLEQQRACGVSRVLLGVVRDVELRAVTRRQADGFSPQAAASVDATPAASPRSSATRSRSATGARWCDTPTRVILIRDAPEADREAQRARNQRATRTQSDDHASRARGVP